MAARDLMRTSSLEVMIPQLKIPKSKSKVPQVTKPIKTRMTLSDARAKLDINFNSIPVSDTKKQHKEPYESQTAKAIRSAILTLTAQEAQKNKLKKPLLPDKTDKDSLQGKKGSLKGKGKKSLIAKSKSKSNSLASSKDHFVEYDLLSSKFEICI